MHSTATAPSRGQSKNPQPLSAVSLDDALLRVGVVEQAVGFSASSIRRKVADGTFPEPVKLGTRCTRWRAADVRAWIQAQGRPALPSTVAATVTAPDAAPRPSKIRDPRAAFEAAKAVAAARRGSL